MTEPIERSLFEAPPLAEQERMIEAMLFASAAPLTLAALAARMPQGCDPAEALAALRRRYDGRGVNLVRVGAAWAFRTAPDLGAVMQLETVETRKLSRAAIETLAIIAYHQPVTRGDIEEIRGVAVSAQILKTLEARGWIEVVGTRDTPGKPQLFATTKQLLDDLNLRALQDLPSLQDIGALLEQDTVAQAWF